MKVFRDTSTNKLIKARILERANRPIAIIHQIDFDSHPNLYGWVEADFPDSFIFAYGTGSGNPRYVKCIEKSTGKKYVDGILVGADEKEQVLVYMENTHSDSIAILDIKNNRKLYTTDFAKFYSVQPLMGLSGYINIDSISSQSITLVIDAHDMYIRKTYKRK
jgi:hypothetical protein